MGVGVSQFSNDQFSPPDISAGDTPSFEFVETDQTLPAGRWRWIVNNDALSLEKNTAAAGDYTTKNTYLTFATNGMAMFNPSSNSPAAAIAGFEMVTGRDSNGAAVAGSNPDIAIQYGGASGGFRHWITTRHHTVANTDNRFNLYLNTGATVGASSAPGTGNLLSFTVVTSSATQSQIWMPDGSAAAPSYSFSSGTNMGMFRLGSNRLALSGGSSGSFITNDHNNGNYAAVLALGFAASITDGPGGASDLLLLRDAANVLALRNGTSAQTFRVYGRFVSASDSTFIRFEGGAANCFITADRGGGSDAPNLTIGTTVAATSLFLRTAGTNRWQVNDSGHLAALANYQVRAGNDGYSFANDTDTDIRIIPVSGEGIAFTVDGTARFRVNSSGANFRNDGVLAWSADANLFQGAGVGLALQMDAVQVLAVRNGLNTQTVRIYKQISGANYERFFITHDGTNYKIGSQQNGGGFLNYGLMVNTGNDTWLFNTTGQIVAQVGLGAITHLLGPTDQAFQVMANTGRAAIFGTDGTAFIQANSGGQLMLGSGGTWQISTGNHLLATTDNLRNIGAVGATRPANGYFGTAVVIGHATIGAGTCVIDGSAAQTPQLLIRNAGAESIGIRRQASTDNLEILVSNSLTYRFVSTGFVPTTTSVTDFGSSSLLWRSVYTSGGYTCGIATKVANYTATADDSVILGDATAGAITITLPAAASHTGRIYRIKKIDSSANKVTIDPNLAELIDGAATHDITTQYTSRTIISDGVNWHII